MMSRRMYPSNPSVPTSQYSQQRSVNAVPNAYSSHGGVPSSQPPPNPTPLRENIASQFSGMNLGPTLQSSSHQPHPSHAPPTNNGAIIGQSTGIPPTNPLLHGGTSVGPPPTGLTSSRHTPPTSSTQPGTSILSGSLLAPPPSMGGPSAGVSSIPSRSGPPIGYHPQMDGSPMSHHINAPPISSSVSMVGRSTEHHTLTGPPMGGPPTGGPLAGYHPQMGGTSTRHRPPLSGPPMGGFTPAPPTNKIEQPPSSMQLAPPPTGQLPLAPHSSAPPLTGSSMSSSSLPPPPPSIHPQPNTIGTQPHSMVPQPHTAGTQPHIMRTHPNMMGPQPHTAGTQPHAMGTHPNMMGPQPHTAGTQPHAMGTHPNMMGPQSHTVGTQPHTRGTHPNMMGPQPHTAGTQPHTMGTRPNMTGPQPHTTGTYIYDEVEAGSNAGMSLAGPPPPTINQMTAPPRQQYPHSGPKPPMGGVYPGAPPIQPHPSQIGPQAPPQQLLPDIQPVNLLESRNILPTTPLSYSTPLLPGHLRDHCPDPAVFCSTMSTVPATSSLLNKLKLPFAIHIHPFKDSKAKSCPVINPSVIVRCRVCRAYINPFVSFIDARHWRCNLCFRNNIVPEDYDYNPHTGKRGDRSHHAELRHASVEYIAPSEYMVRPPQPSVYFFVIDVTYPTVESGLLGLFCRTLLDCLTKLPGDGRTMVGFLTFDHNLHFYNLKPNQAQPQMLVVSDLDDPFIPSPNSLLVNLRESKELIKNLLEDLPRMFSDQHSVQNALGSALQVAEKLLHPIGGRITVLQSSMPNIGPGVIKMREQTSATKMDQLNMSAGSDFYKKLALECSAQQIAVDLFVFSNSSQCLDLATMSTVAKYSSGQIKYYQNFHYTKTIIKEQVERDFKRYFTRNIGFEAVMRIRCTEGLSLHTFHGNFFVRSTDLLSLPNVNPDHGYCMNMAIDESLKEFSMVCFQAALLYTTYRGERRIRVHTLCLPVSDQPAQIYAGLNIQAIVGVLAKMGADRMSTATLGDARDALVNTIEDATIAYRSILASSMQSSQFCLPASLRLLPLFTLSLLKHSALTLSSRVLLDSRSNSMNIIFTLPLNYLMSVFYPKLYALHSLTDKDLTDKDGVDEVTPPILQLSAEKLTRFGVFLMDYGLGIYIWVSKEVPQDIVKDIFGVPHFGAIPEYMMELPLLENTLSKLVNALINQIRITRQHFMPLLVIREDGPHRLLFINYLIEDKTEDGTSYYEFLSHVARQITKK